MDVKLIPRSEGCFRVVWGERDAGSVCTHRNSFHARNVYLSLALTSYDTALARPLFDGLLERLDCPLEVMLDSAQGQQIRFLEAGGFRCVRKCFQAEVTGGDLLDRERAAPRALYCLRGSREFDLCGALLYDYYQETHRAVSPLTADCTTFLGRLPDKAYYRVQGRKITDAVFVEGNEIAYVCTSPGGSFHELARGAVRDLFRSFPRLVFEADDCDRAAMSLCALFRLELDESYDTYLRRI